MRTFPAALVFSAALLCRHASAASIQKKRIVEDRDLSGLLSGAISVLDAVPGLVGQAINTTVQIVEALQELVSESGISRNELDHLLDLNGTTGRPVKNVTSQVKCPDIAVVYARGTYEPGNVGFLTGPPFFDALSTYMGNGTVAVQGVNDYPAVAAGFFAGGSKNGAHFMARVAAHTQAECPDTRLTISGYSQGSQVARLAIAQMPAGAMAKISSVVLFGDPLGGKPIPGVDPTKLLVVCHTGDNICQGGDYILDPHLDYSLDAPTAALFVMQRTTLGLASKDAKNEGMSGTMVGRVQDIMRKSKKQWG